MTGRPTAIVYVDGFNLYRRCLDTAPGLKWLDLFALAQELMPDHTIVKVRYFTALLRQGLLADVRAPVRQQMYLRALATRAPEIEVHLGKFRRDNRLMPTVPLTVSAQTGDYEKVLVRKLEEKGSDVNLASRMVADACHHRAEYFVLLSNDSDQAGTLRLLKNELGVMTGIIFPVPSVRGAKELVQTDPDFLTSITGEALLASQFPTHLVDSVGTFHKPNSWW